MYPGSGVAGWSPRPAQGRQDTLCDGRSIAMFVERDGGVERDLCMSRAKHWVSHEWSTKRVNCSGGQSSSLLAVVSMKYDCAATNLAIAMTAVVGMRREGIVPHILQFGVQAQSPHRTGVASFAAIRIFVF